MIIVVALILIILFIVIAVCGTSSGRKANKDMYNAYYDNNEPYPMDNILKDGLSDYPVIDEDYDYENDRYYNDGDDKYFF